MFQIGDIVRSKHTDPVVFGVITEAKENSHFSIWWFNKETPAQYLYGWFSYFQKVE